MCLARLDTHTRPALPHKDRTANTIATSKARPIAISRRITVCAFFEGHLVTRSTCFF